MPARFAMILLSFLALVPGVGAQTNWPSFRGPNAIGIAAGAACPTIWNTEKSENILWKSPIPGLGHSSPIVWGDRLFVTTAVNQSKTAPLKVGLYGEPDHDSRMLEWGFASSPIIYNGCVFLQCDVLTNGFVAALKIATGHEVWRTRRDDTGTWSTPNVCAEGPRPQLVVNGWKHMGGYDLRTGEEIWRMSGGGDCPVPTPMVWNGLIFLMSAHVPRSPIYAIRTGAAGDVKLRKGARTNEYVSWSVPRGGSYMETPLTYSD